MKDCFMDISTWIYSTIEDFIVATYVVFDYLNLTGSKPQDRGNHLDDSFNMDDHEDSHDYHEAA